MESLWHVESTKIIHIVLFIGAHFVLQTNAARECPFNPAPCVCPYGTLTCSSVEDLTALYQEVGDLNITSIYFRGGNITSISGNNLPPGLEYIYFSNQPLTNISEDALNSSAQTLNSLTIIGAQFLQLPKALLVLTNLTSLRIQDAPIQNWDDSVLEHITANVKYLQLKNVSLTIWPRSISSSRTLVSLDLSYNPLKYIPDDAFQFLNYTLKDLDLSQTGLTKVPMALFSLSNLSRLDLSGIALSNVTDIEQLESMPFATGLVFITLESSQIKTILNFSSFTSLDTITLNNNSITDATPGSFPPSLTYLSLKENRLTAVPTAIAHLPQLAELFLSHNQIASIEPGSLPPSLTTLDLSYNKISVITNTSFINMKNVTYLSLYSNPISIIDPSAFSDLVSLKYLNLGRSSLMEIPLAVTSLPADIDLSMFETGYIRCPCPPPQELVDWFALTNGTVPFFMSCDSYQSAEQYLTTGCVSTSTTITTVALTDTTHRGSATSLQRALFSIRGSLLILTTAFLMY
ncbi:unnamed protein product [Candidula unifasciata]|uniref:Uncharacterized protein n=1 Tax=Candidula unifasciata TaxID=100452 RepID=A0A8S3ZBP5_9EUPU|nr:unnamed protein product [Candidula unifasciata]